MQWASTLLKVIQMASAWTSNHEEAISGAISQTDLTTDEILSKSPPVKLPNSFESYCKQCL
jgi:hypothetical protein